MRSGRHFLRIPAPTDLPGRISAHMPREPSAPRVGGTIASGPASPISRAPERIEEVVGAPRHAARGEGRHAPLHECAALKRGRALRHRAPEPRHEGAPRTVDRPVIDRPVIDRPVIDRPVIDRRGPALGRRARGGAGRAGPVGEPTPVGAPSGAEMRPGRAGVPPESGGRRADADHHSTETARDGAQIAA